MQQVLLNIGTGATSLIDAPVPSLQQGHVLIRTQRTLISAGTERMLIDFGRASMLERARQQPDKVKMLFQKMRTDGLMVAMGAVRSKLDQPLALGYCNVGTVIEAGAGITQFRTGDRVVSNGSHAGMWAHRFLGTLTIPAWLPKMNPRYSRCWTRLACRACAW